MPQLESESTDVLAVIRAPLEQYPPSVNQVALLAKAGLRVTVLDLFHPRCGMTQFDQGTHVQRLPAGQHTLSPEESFPALGTRLRRSLKFLVQTWRAVRRCDPKVVI